MLTFQIICNWESSQSITEKWAGRFGWSFADRFRLVVDNNPDFWIVLNAMPNNVVSLEPAKCIIFRMEPKMHERPDLWGAFTNPSSTFYHVQRHEAGYWNLMEWHIQDISRPIKTRDGIMSAILSDKYTDPGHRLRVDFVKHAQHSVPIDVFGTDMGYTRYHGSLPPYQKDDGLRPYKYTIAVENHSIPFYVTEKLFDAILSECLCFYWGAPNLADLIPEDAFISLPLEDPEKALEIVRNAMESKQWETRINSIREAKQRLLTEQGLYQRLMRIIPSTCKLPAPNAR